MCRHRNRCGSAPAGAPAGTVFQGRDAFSSEHAVIPLSTRVTIVASMSTGVSGPSPPGACSPASAHPRYRATARALRIAFRGPGMRPRQRSDQPGDSNDQDPSSPGESPRLVPSPCSDCRSHGWPHRLQQNWLNGPALQEDSRCLLCPSGTLLDWNLTGTTRCEDGQRFRAVNGDGIGRSTKAIHIGALS